jgi:hypothetical protein
MEQFVAMRISISNSPTPDRALNSLEGSVCPIEAIISIFDSFLGLDIGQYKRFSMIEWSLLIKTIISVFELLASALSQPAHHASKVNQISSFGHWLERIRDQMSQHSQIPTDIFGLFSSVLEVVQRKYESMSNQLGVLDGEETSWWGQQGHMVSLCPVVNGSLKGTPHWTALGEDYSVFENLLQGIDWESPASS